MQKKLLIALIGLFMGSVHAQTLPMEQDREQAGGTSTSQLKSTKGADIQNVINPTDPNSRFHFSRFTPENTGSNGLRNTSYTSVAVGPQGFYYFANSYGIDVFDGRGWRYLNTGTDLLGAPNLIASGNMVTDGNGNLWVGTTYGLENFDSNLNTLDKWNSESGLTNNRVNTLMLQSNGNLWIGHAFDPEKGFGGITVLTDTVDILNITDGLMGGYIEDIHERANGDIWITTASDPSNGDFGGITVWKADGTIVEYTKENSGLPQEEVTEMTEDANGVMWIGLYPNINIDNAPGGVVSFDGENWTTYTPDQLNGVSTTWTLELDENGNVVRGSAGETQVFNGTEWELKDTTQPYHRLDGVLGMNSNNVHNEIIYVTGNGFNASNNGIHIYDADFDSWGFISSVNDGGIFSDDIFGISLSPDGDLWLSGFHGASVNPANDENFYPVGEYDGLPNAYVWKVLAASNGEVWFGVVDGGVTRLTSDGTMEVMTDDEFEEDVYEDSQGGIWATSNTNGIMYYDGTDVTIFDTTAVGGKEIWAITEGPNNLVYASTDKGVATFDGSTWTMLDLPFEIIPGEVRPGELHFVPETAELWIVNGTDQIYIYNGTDYGSVPRYIGINAIDHDSDGTVWLVGTGVQGVSSEFIYLVEKGTRGVNHTFYDVQVADDQLILGSFGGGVYRMNLIAPVEITAAYDYPDDNGGFITLNIDGFTMDSFAAEQVDEMFKAKTLTVWRFNANYGGNWEAVMTSNLLGDPEGMQVTVPVPTTFVGDFIGDEEVIADGHEEGIPYGVHMFRVSAHNLNGDPIAMSQPVAAFALDNIVPEPIEGVSIDVQDGDIIMGWMPSPESDVDRYLVYDWNEGNYLENEPVAVSFSNFARFTGDIEASYVVVAEDQHLNKSDVSDMNIVTSNEAISELPLEFNLSNIYPNPFNPQATIAFELPSASEVNITLYNVLGHKVATVASKSFAAGNHTVQLDGSNLASGMYFVRAQLGNELFTKQVTLIK